MKLPGLKGFDEEAFNKYFKNTGWLMFGKILSMVTNLVIARYLMASSFGELSFADAFTLIIAAVGALGLDTFIIREILNEPHKKDEILGTALLMRLGVNALLIPLTVGIYLFFHNYAEKPGDPLTWIILILSFASFFKSFNVIDSYFQSQVASKYVVKVQNVCVILSAGVKILLVVFKMPLIYFAASITFDSLALSAGLVYMYHHRGFSLFTWTFDFKRARNLLKQSFPLILSAVMVSIYMKIDQVMLKSVGSVEVGIYSAAAKLSEAWYFIPVAIVTSVFPALINARKTDLDRYTKRLRNLYDLLVFISVPVAVFITFTAPFIIQLLYGGKYDGAGPMLAIHIWSGVFVFLGSASSQYLLAEGYTMISFQRTAMGAIVNILLNFWLIPKYGGIGASIATLIACVVSAFYLLFISKTRQQGIVMLKSLFLFTVFQKVFKRQKNLPHA
ncbi:O-antigen/teichoic acid export membrane protein [Pedobacter cryoconitis]|uniref:O-antigen/teichoic acid export membrane protein n=1 Tax=Pedobacter cryoconitis TaxID=188932 RepID=A0A7W8ZME0_9SPHI|nr:flippase [Pedobacter cryoconitis]MBB5636671.1 O-antigen/teichoic acid export membrane protein [Pedobacter cryoconitis]MBB6274665.1 O-antigen/teichoic acid export membrane protein [Pedobacter cryoconitis]